MRLRNEKATGSAPETGPDLPLRLERTTGFEPATSTLARRETWSDHCRFARERLTNLAESGPVRSVDGMPDGMSPTSPTAPKAHLTPSWTTPVHCRAPRR